MFEIPVEIVQGEPEISQFYSLVAVKTCWVWLSQLGYCVKPPGNKQSPPETPPGLADRLSSSLGCLEMF